MKGKRLPRVPSFIVYTPLSFLEMPRGNPANAKKYFFPVAGIPQAFPEMDLTFTGALQAA